MFSFVTVVKLNSLSMTISCFMLLALLFSMLLHLDLQSTLNKCELQVKVHLFFSYGSQTIYLKDFLHS